MTTSSINSTYDNNNDIKKIMASSDDDIKQSQEIITRHSKGKRRTSYYNIKPYDNKLSQQIMTTN